MKGRSVVAKLIPGLAIVGFSAVLVSLAVITASASAIPAAGGPDAGRLDAFYEAQIAVHNLRGMAVIIVKSDGQGAGSVVYERGFGMAGRDLPFTPQTPFPISSGSKSFLALSVMQLVEAGKVQLDAPMQLYLPWWRARASMTTRG